MARQLAGHDEEQDVGLTENPEFLRSTGRGKGVNSGHPLCVLLDGVARVGAHGFVARDSAGWATRRNTPTL